jgi:hypothetical protein
VGRSCFLPHDGQIAGAPGYAWSEAGRGGLIHPAPHRLPVFIARALSNIHGSGADEFQAHVRMLAGY